MNTDDLQRLAEDLRRHLRLKVEAFPDSNPEGLHVLRIKGVDFFFHSDGSGYDGWGKDLVRAEQQGAEDSKTKGETMKNEQNPIRVVIYVSGGIVQDVLAEDEGVEAMVVDYDNEEGGEPKSSRSFEEVPVNRAYIEKTIQGIEY